MNLNNVTTYYLDKTNKTITVDFNCANADDILYNVLKFKTYEEAQQCIEFLDKKTFCETFELTKNE
jgi:hypothetical protein